MAETQENVMTGLFQKARSITLSNLHSLLDAVIDLNKIGDVKQHIRDLEVAKEQIASEAAVAKSRVASAETEIKHVQERMTKDNADIDFILTDGDPSNDDLALPLQKRVDAAKEDLEVKQNDLQVQKQTATALAQATAKLEGKCQEMIRNVKRLEQMERTSNAQEKAAAALNQAAAATAVGDKASIDSVEQRTRDHAAVASAKFERAMESVESSTDDDVATAKAKAAIAARRAALQGNK